MTQGKEEGMFKRSQGVVKSVQKVTAAKNFIFYPDNPRMVPDAFKPTLNKVCLRCALKQDGAHRP